MACECITLQEMQQSAGIFHLFSLLAPLSHSVYAPVPELQWIQSVSDTGKEAVDMNALCSAPAGIRPLKQRRRLNKTHDPVVDLPSDRKSQVFK